MGGCPSWDWIHSSDSSQSSDRSLPLAVEQSEPSVSVNIVPLEYNANTDRNNWNGSVRDLSHQSKAEVDAANRAVQSGDVEALRVDVILAGKRFITTSQLVELLKSLGIHENVETSWDFF